MSDAQPPEGGRASEGKPDQGKPVLPVAPAWPAADAGPWPDDDTDDTDAAPLRDETHVGPHEPSVTPPGEPDWPADDPGPTTELPVSALPTPSTSDAAPTPHETPTHAFPTADTDSPPPGDVTPAPAGPATHSTADAPPTPDDLSSADTAEVPRPAAPAHPEPPDDHTAPDLPAAEPEAEPAAKRNGPDPLPPPADSSADARDQPAPAPSPDSPADEHDQDGSEPDPDGTSAGLSAAGRDQATLPTASEDPSPGFPAAGGDEADGQSPADGSPAEAPAERDESGPAESPPNSFADERDKADARSGLDDRPSGLSVVERDEAGARPGSDDTSAGFSPDSATTRPTARPPQRPSRPDLPRRGPVPPRPYGPPPVPPPTGHPPRSAPPERPAERTVVVRPVRSVRPEPPAEPTAFVRPVAPEPPAERTMVVRRAPARQAPPEEPAERTTVVAALAAPDSDSGPEAKSANEAESRKRKTALIVVVAVVAVLALAAGVVLWVPGVAEKLGLAGEEPVAIAPPPAAVEFRPALAAPGDSAPAPTPDGVAAALAGPAAAGGLGALTGVVIDPANGQVLYAKGGDTARVPASTTKVLSTAAVLLAMPHTDQLSTKVVRGDKPGTVVIVGGGDPTLSALAAGKESVYPGAPHLDDLVEQVKATGPVDTVLVDTGRYTGADFAAGWERVDIAAGHITPIVPAMLDGGRGDPTKATTARSANPARTIAQAFADRIGATVPAEATTTAKPDAEVLGEVKSAPVAELVDTVLQRSDNVLAETLIRELAVATGKEPSFTGATEAVAAVLKENGFTVDALQLRDGSGLSTQNRATATLLAEVLQVAAAPDGTDPRTAKLRPLLAGLPVAGGSGTLAGRYQEGPAAEGRGWVRAKTGTLPSVRANSLAGIVLDTDGRLLVFALMADGPDTLQARADLDDVAAALHGCGCR
ncbi:D-alanyl-D-alanine carboxypeptidase/D-alanyl-D-alanine-endopeptidase [Actinokineospora guangxiensis]|uniref:D-alanyl-D-alanine carboxypeptidase/D-alanyl-D-alanine-endopeptidase n=1 Tax=Actinokineospora guangxiensis TaxID=1490288 RepID=A0ABW0EMK2_9PSEU